MSAISDYVRCALDVVRVSVGNCESDKRIYIAWVDNLCGLEMIEVRVSWVFITVFKKYVSAWSRATVLSESVNNHKKSVLIWKYREKSIEWNRISCMCSDMDFFSICYRILGMNTIWMTRQGFSFEKSDSMKNLFHLFQCFGA